MLSNHFEFFLTVLWQEVECIKRMCEISFLDVIFLGHPNMYVCKFSCSCLPFRAVLQRQLPCFKCDAFESRNIVTENGISMTLVVSAVGSDRWGPGGNNPVRRPETGHHPY